MTHTASRLSPAAIVALLLVAIAPPGTAWSHPATTSPAPVSWSPAPQLQSTSRVANADPIPPAGNATTAPLDLAGRLISRQRTTVKAAGLPVGSGRFGRSVPMTRYRTGDCVGATIEWTGQAQDGQWSTAGNWTPVRVPASYDYVCLPAGSEVTISTTAVAANLDILTGALLEVSTAAAGSFAIQTNGVVSNAGTVRLTGAGGFQLGCGSVLTNNGLIQATTTAGSATVTTFTASATNCSTRPKLVNTATGTLQSLANLKVSFDGYITLENDGVAATTTATLAWRSWSPTPATATSTGRFTGATNAPLELSNVEITTATTFDNGVVITNGTLTGTGTIPAGVTLTLSTNGGLYAPMTGPGWISAQAGTLNADITGNIRIEPPSGGLVTTSTSPLTIQSTGVVAILTGAAYQFRIDGGLTNNGTIRVSDIAGFQQSCGTVVTNNGLLQITVVGGSPTISTFTATSTSCSLHPLLWNNANGVFESLSQYSPIIAAGLDWENDGSLIANGDRWLLIPTNVDIIHDGYFGSAGDGHLVLCGLFLVSGSAEMADDVGLADQCGTMVADVTDFTAQQIQDIKSARNAALALPPPPTNDDGWPACYFQGVDLTELYDTYPDICVYTPQQWGMDAYEFFISWMPGLGTGLDIGHAIFGTDLAGRELSPSEQILAGLWAVFPGAVNELNLSGTARLRYRALLNGAASCNSFDGATPVVLADGSTKPIETIHRSDLVLAADPVTGRLGSRPVVEVITGYGVKHLVDIDLSSGERIAATDNHPFWVANQFTFVEAGSLHVGDLLRTSAGTYVQVSALQTRTVRQRVYNLNVANLHTFHVGTTGVLVHNSNPSSDGACRAALRNALGASPFHSSVTVEAHHIFGVKQFGTDLGQKLQRPVNEGGFGIDLNSIDNGILLPKVDNPNLGSYVGAFHNGRSRNVYVSFVNGYLDAATTRDDALARLQDLKDWILEGCVPINQTGSNQGVRVKPAYGTCPQFIKDFYYTNGENWIIEAPAP